MYLEIFLADFAVFCVFWGISRDFAEIPEFLRGSATARNIRSPVPVEKHIFLNPTAKIPEFLNLILNAFFGLFLTNSLIKEIQLVMVCQPNVLFFVCFSFS